jgi:hypothetical protein
MMQARTAVVMVWILLSTPPVVAQESSNPVLAGVWSATVTSFSHPAWDIVDLFGCNCTPEAYDYLRGLLQDPANDHLSADEVQRMVASFNRQAINDLLTEAGRRYEGAYDHADDPSIFCEPFGVFRTILHNDPIHFDQTTERLVITTEDLASDRTVYMNTREHPDGPPTSLGHSVGWYEGVTLVIETVGVSANVADDNLGIHNSSLATSIERYTLSPDGRKLHLVFTLTDPGSYSGPLTLERMRIFTPEVSMEDAPCESISGQF